MELTAGHRFPPRPNGLERLVPEGVHPRAACQRLAHQNVQAFHPPRHTPGTDPVDFRNLSQPSAFGEIALVSIEILPAQGVIHRESLFHLAHASITFECPDGAG